MEDWRKKLERPATRLEVGGFRPTGQRDASSFGRISLVRPGETWPIWNDQPLWPVCQLNISEAPFAPPHLRDLSVISVFVAGSLDGLWTFKTATANEASDQPWCIRAYETLEGLVEPVQPHLDIWIRPFEARWHEVEQDYPTHDLMPIELPPQIEENYYDIEGVRTLNGTKLGGWPSCIQGEPWWTHQADSEGFEYALQVDSEGKAKWAWGDGGAAYFARSKANPNRWALDWQSF